jgi:hypothetical protein
LEDLGIERKINNMRMDRREMGWKGVDWIHLVQERDQWWALVNTVTDFWVPYKEGNLTT